MIETRNLTKRYGNLTALQNLTLRIEPGETFGLLGPNGAGKTTTLRLLAGMMEASEGELSVVGMDPWRQPEAVRSLMGVLLDGAALYERMTVEENLKLFAGLFGAPVSRVGEALALTGVSDLRRQRAGKLSKGQRQRVALARAMVHAPKLLFLDEPTAGLDPTAVASFHDLLRSLKLRGTTILLASHDMAEVEALCDRVAILEKGQMVAAGRPAELKAQFGRRNLVVQVETSKGVETFSFPLDEPEVGRHLTECQQKGRLLSVRSEEASLSEVFVHVTGRKLA